MFIESDILPSDNLLESSTNINNIDSVNEEVEDLFRRTGKFIDNVKLYAIDDDPKVYVEFSELHRYMNESNIIDMQSALSELAEANDVEQNNIVVLFPSLEATGYVTGGDKQKIKWSSEQIRNTINKGILCTKCNEAMDLLENALKDIEYNETEIVDEAGTAHATVLSEKPRVLFHKAINLIKSGHLEGTIDKRIEACNKLIKSLEDEKIHIKKYATPSPRFKTEMVAKTVVMDAITIALLFALTTMVPYAASLKVKGYPFSEILHALKKVKVVFRKRDIAMVATSVGINGAMKISEAYDIINQYIYQTKQTIKYLEEEKKKIVEKEKDKKEDK